MSMVANSFGSIAIKRPNSSKISQSLSFSNDGIIFYDPNLAECASLLLGLKDKIKSLHGMEEIPISESNTIKEETLSALEVLGYSRKSSEKVVDNLIHGNPSITIEDLIKGALNKL